LNPFGLKKKKQLGLGGRGWFWGGVLEGRHQAGVFAGRTGEFSASIARRDAIGLAAGPAGKPKHLTFRNAVVFAGDFGSMSARRARHLLLIRLIGNLKQGLALTADTENRLAGALGKRCQNPPVAGWAQDRLSGIMTFNLKSSPTMRTFKMQHVQEFSSGLFLF
jgi:hypothetical protein